jgi:hypothetical protein
MVYANYLGISLDDPAEKDLIEIARQALLDLPAGWELGIGEDTDNPGIPYFFDTRTETSVWHHPKEKVYRKRVEEAKADKKCKAATAEQGCAALINLSANHPANKAKLASLGARALAHTISADSSLTEGARSMARVVLSIISEADV